VIGDGAARGHPLCWLVAQPQTMKVFEWILRSLDHLDSDEGDDLLGKMAPWCCVVGKWKGRNASVDEMGSPFRLFMHVYIGEEDVAKHKPKQQFGFQEPLVHY
jgi:hypothetical protein